MMLSSKLYFGWGSAPDPTRSLQYYLHSVLSAPSLCTFRRLL